LILVTAQHASSGLSGWEQLGIVVAGSLIAAAIIGLFSWTRKPAHRVHVARTSLRAQIRDFDEDDPEAPSREFRIGLDVTSTADISLEVMLRKLSITLNDDLLDELEEPFTRHQLAPGQHHTFSSTAPFEPMGFFDTDAPEWVTVEFEIDYGRPVMWWLRRRITATIEAKMPDGFFKAPTADPRGTLSETYATGGSPRDRLVWPWST
jgi:hypothetical protein